MHLLDEETVCLHCMMHTCYLDPRRIRVDLCHAKHVVVCVP